MALVESYAWNVHLYAQDYMLPPLDHLTRHCGFRRPEFMKLGESTYILERYVQNTVICVTLRRVRQFIQSTVVSLGCKYDSLYVDLCFLGFQTYKRDAYKYGLVFNMFNDKRTDISVK